jgi:hypothetical protein
MRVGPTGGGTTAEEAIPEEQSAQQALF